MHTDLSPSPEPSHTGRRMLVLALLMAVTVQVVIAVRSPTISKDGIVFINVAKGLTTTPIETMRTSDQHPGYPAMILVGRRIAALFPGTEGHVQWMIGANLFSGLGGLAAIVLAWLIARRLFDPRIAGIAAILFAALPDFRRNAVDAFADMPHLALYLAAAWTAIEGFSSEKPRWFIGSGIASALAYWTRPEGITAAVVIAGVLAVTVIVRRGESRRFALLSLAAVVICAGVVAAPYPLIKGTLTSKKHVGELMHIETWTSHADDRAVNEPAAPRTADAQALHTNDGQAQRKGDRSLTQRSLLRGMAKRAYDLGKELFGAFLRTFRYFLVLPLLVGLIHVRRRAKATVSGRLIALMVACHTTLLIALYFIADYISRRHTMPIVALVMPWTALGWVLSVEWVCRFARRVRPAHALCAFLTLFVILTSIESVKPLHTQRLGVIRAAEWVKDHSSRSDRVLSNSLYAAFHADREPVLVGSHPNIPKDMNAAAMRTAPFIVFDTRAHDFKEKWLSHIEDSHDLVTLPDMPPSHKPVLVYVAKGALANSPLQ